MEKTELFDAYISNSLSDEERNSFESELQENDEFATEFRIHKAVKLAIKKKGENDLRGRFRELQAENSKDEFSNEFDEQIQMYMNAAYFSKGKKASKDEETVIDYEVIKKFLQGKKGE